MRHSDRMRVLCDQLRRQPTPALTDTCDTATGVCQHSDQLQRWAMPDLRQLWIQEPDAVFTAIV